MLEMVVSCLHKNNNYLYELDNINLTLMDIIIQIFLIKRLLSKSYFKTFMLYRKRIKGNWNNDLNSSPSDSNDRKVYPLLLFDVRRYINRKLRNILSYITISVLCSRSHISFLSKVF